MTTPDLDALIADSLSPRATTGGRPSKARTAEKRRRYTMAQTLAKTALTKLHPEDFAALYEQAKAKVDAERGELPA